MKGIRIAIKGICAYKELLEKAVMRHALCLLDCIHKQDGERALAEYTSLFYALREAGHHSLGEWLWDELRFSETPFSAMIDSGRSDPALENAAQRDVETLLQLAEISCDRYIDRMKILLGQDYVPTLMNLPRWSTSIPFRFETLEQFYRQNGGGVFARSKAFLWNGGTLYPIADPDCPQASDLLGYEMQRNQVIANTRALVDGRAVNNVLLYGDGGTGKSATVKSLLYMDGMEALRLIEIDKDDLGDLPSLIRTLEGRRQKFILFIDDLAFDQDDKTYSSLKTILEGGLARRPSNVAVYATSNRRNLVRQTFSDRSGDEVDMFETISEKTALAERFGLRIPYLTMNKVDYLALVEHLAKQAGIEMLREQLHHQAMQWEIRHSGRTPRTARQFIASLNTQV